MFSNFFLLFLLAQLNTWHITDAQELFYRSLFPLLSLHPNSWAWFWRWMLNLFNCSLMQQSSLPLSFLHIPPSRKSDGQACAPSCYSAFPKQVSPSALPSPFSLLVWIFSVLCTDLSCHLLKEAFSYLLLKKCGVCLLVTSPALSFYFDGSLHVCPLSLLELLSSIKVGIILVTFWNLNRVSAVTYRC